MYTPKRAVCSCKDAGEQAEPSGHARYYTTATDQVMKTLQYFTACLGFSTRLFRKRTPSPMEVGRVIMGKWGLEGLQVQFHSPVCLVLIFHRILLVCSMQIPG